MISQQTFNQTIAQVNQEFKRLNDKIAELEKKLDKKADKRSKKPQEL